MPKLSKEAIEQAFINFARNGNGEAVRFLCKYVEDVEKMNEAVIVMSEKNDFCTVEEMIRTWEADEELTDELINISYLTYKPTMKTHLHPGIHRAFNRKFNVKVCKPNREDKTPADVYILDTTMCSTYPIITMGDLFCIPDEKPLIIFGCCGSFPRRKGHSWNIPGEDLLSAVLEIHKWNEFLEQNNEIK